MSRRLLIGNPSTIRRVARWTIVLFPVVLLGLVLAFWIHGQLPVGTYWKAGG